MKNCISGITGNRRRALFHRALINSLPVLMGYSTMGFAAGVLLALHGHISFSPLWAAISSAIFVSGPLQYLFADWVNKLTTLGPILLIVVCVNFRYALYGLSLIERFKGISPLKKLYLIGTITDETYALQMGARRIPAGAPLHFYCLTLTALDHIYWVGGVTVGALTGSIVGAALPPERIASATRGIEFAMTSLFLVILAEQLRERANRIPAIVGLCAATLTFICFGVSNMLIPSLVLIITSFLILKRKLDEH